MLKQNIDLSKLILMTGEENLKYEKEILRHFENLKTGLLKALRKGVFQNFDETTEIKTSIAAIENYIEQSFVGVAFDK